MYEKYLESAMAPPKAGITRGVKSAGGLLKPADGLQRFTVAGQVFFHQLMKLLIDLERLKPGTR
jgi:hypothetical protein